MYLPDIKALESVIFRTNTSSNAVGGDHTATERLQLEIGAAPLVPVTLIRKAFGVWRSAFSVLGDRRLRSVV
jgi:hypothetical protein